MTRETRLRLAAAAVGALLVTPVFAQETQRQLREEIEALKQGQEQIRKDLQEINQLLRGQQRGAPAAPNLRDKVFDLGANPVKGERTATITLIEFTDYQ